MRSSPLFSRSSLLGALAVSTLALAFDQGCASFGDLPDYSLAPTAGAGGAAGNSSAGTGGSGAASGSGGTASGGGGTTSKGGAGGSGGTGSGAGGDAGAGGEGDAGAGGDAGSGGDAGAGDAGASGNKGGNGGKGGSAGAGGVAGANGGSAGQSGAGAGGGGTAGTAGVGGGAGTSGGAAGSAGNPGGNGGDGGTAGSGGSDGGTAGAAGTGGSPATGPEIVVQNQSDPGTLLLRGNALFWVNEANAGSGKVATLTLPGATTNPAAVPTYVVPSANAPRDIAFFNDRLFLLRGTGKAQQTVVSSFLPDGGAEIVIHPCVDEPGALGLGAQPCQVNALGRMIATESGVSFSGRVAGTTASTVAGLRSCGAGMSSCTVAIAESGSGTSTALTSVGVGLFFVSSANKKNITRAQGASAAAFTSLPDEIVDLTTDGNLIYALTQPGRIVSIAPGDKTTKEITTGAGTNGQRIVAVGDALYWTASDAGDNKGIVGTVKKNGSGKQLLSTDRQAPRGIAVDTSTGSPHVYFTDGSDTVQRIRLP